LRREGSSCWEERPIKKTRKKMVTRIRIRVLVVETRKEVKKMMMMRWMRDWVKGWDSRMTL
jgi:hypothetical protein